jgi:MtrB/PioB family decaheme-associated outer membrane protein
MTKQYSLRAIALAGVCLAPLAAAAQDFDLGDASAAPAAQPEKHYNNEVDIGGRYQSSTSPLFGRYTGTDSKGFGSTGAFRLQDTENGPGNLPLNIETIGKNLDFSANHQGPNSALAPESELGLTLSQQGVWKAGVSYNAITYNGQTIMSPYNSSGGLAPGLVPFGGQVQTGTSKTGAPIFGAVPAAGAFGTAAYYLNHPFPEFDEATGTRRDIFGLNGKYIIDAWTITSEVKHEHKEGTVVQSADFSNAGIAFPQPVDYDTDRFNLTAAFNSKRLQAQLGYTVSQFTDNTPFFVAPYFLATSTSVQTVSQYSQPPSNIAHYINGSAGYNLTPTTRLTGNFQYGLEMSDGALGNGTATPLGQIGGTTTANNLGLNPSGDQMVRVYTANLGASTRPLSGLELHAGYGIDGRNTDSNPMTVYGYEHGDGAAALVGNVTQQSWTKQKATLEADYKVLRDTKVSVGYRFDDTDRSGGAANSLPMANIGWVGHSTENTEWAKIADHSLANLNSSLTFEHAVRTGLMELPAGSGAVTTSGITNASMPYYEAPRTADRVKFRADYMAGEDWSVGANARYETNHYHYSQNITGTQRDYNASAGPDVTYSPTKAIALHGFYTYEEIYYVNRGNGLPSTLNGDYGWSAATTNSVHTAGFSAEWKVSDRLKLGTDYTFSYGDIGYNLFDGGLALNSATAASYYNVANLPSVDSSMHSIKVHAEYKLADNVTLTGGYGFDLFKDNDWAYGWAPIIGSNASGLASPLSVNTFTSAEAQPSYRVHSLYTSVRVKF